MIYYVFILIFRDLSGIISLVKVLNRRVIIYART
nr:MAG TPA: hypothetical protein [Caudoviricetes sp.]